VFERDPGPLFQTDMVDTGIRTGPFSWDLAPDGNRFLIKGGGLLRLTSWNSGRCPKTFATKLIAVRAQLLRWTNSSHLCEKQNRKDGQPACLVRQGNTASPKLSASLIRVFAVMRQFTFKVGGIVCSAYARITRLSREGANGTSASGRKVLRYPWVKRRAAGKG